MHRLLLHASRSFLLAALALLFTATDCRSATPGHPKPGMPVTIAIEFPRDIQRGDIGEVTVVATALIDSDDFSLDVQLPREVALYSGDLHQRGAVRANTLFRLGLMVRVPAEGNPVITATARLRAGEAGAFEATTCRAITEPGPATTAAKRGVLMERRGERVREFPIP
jgi:hypothetical protein